MRRVDCSAAVSGLNQPDPNDDRWIDSETTKAREYVDSLPVRDDIATALLSFDVEHLGATNMDILHRDMDLRQTMKRESWLPRASIKLVEQHINYAGGFWTSTTPVEQLLQASPPAYNASQPRPRPDVDVKNVRQSKRQKRSR